MKKSNQQRGTLSINLVKQAWSCVSYFNSVSTHSEALEIVKNKWITALEVVSYGLFGLSKACDAMKKHCVNTS